jgi:hypothetical protein
MKLYCNPGNQLAETLVTFTVVYGDEAVEFSCTTGATDLKSVKDQLNMTTVAASSVKEQ